MMHAAAKKFGIGDLGFGIGEIQPGILRRKRGSFVFADAFF
jgi:hypothetical protein